jgi:hypothetical protein
MTANAISEIIAYSFYELRWQMTSGERRAAIARRLRAH